MLVDVREAKTVVCKAACWVEKRGEARVEG